MNIPGGPYHVIYPMTSCDLDGLGMTSTVKDKARCLSELTTVLRLTFVFNDLQDGVWYMSVQRVETERPQLFTEAMDYVMPSHLLLNGAVRVVFLLCQLQMMSDAFPFALVSSYLIMLIIPHHTSSYLIILIIPHHILIT